MKHENEYPALYTPCPAPGQGVEAFINGLAALAHQTRLFLLPVAFFLGSRLSALRLLTAEL